MVRVLIVDDLEFMRTVLREILERQGFEVAGEARNGREGVHEFERLKPDLVLMDINMPEMDGIGALKRIRISDPKAKVIMCSTISEQDMIFRAIQMGARDYVVKPFREERIRSALSKAAGTGAR